MCVDVAHDRRHCGRCDHACESLENCVDGQCRSGCPDGWKTCADICVDTNTDEDHCGRCDDACTQGEVCVFGQCECAPGWIQCDTGCADLATDVDNCGTCGRPCYTEATIEEAVCLRGMCHVVRCQEGFGDCDGDGSNGCETSLRTVTDCGACQSECSRPHAVGACPLGDCEMDTCDPGWSNCNEDVEDGCEVELNANPNCGSCGRTCDALREVCEGNQCLLLLNDDRVAPPDYLELLSILDTTRETPFVDGSVSPNLAYSDFSVWSSTTWNGRSVMTLNYNLGTTNPGDKSHSRFVMCVAGAI